MQAVMGVKIRCLCSKIKTSCSKQNRTLNLERAEPSYFSIPRAQYQLAIPLFTI